MSLRQRPVYIRLFTEKGKIMRKIIFISLILLGISGAAYANYVPIVKRANMDGFTGCDTAINDTEKAFEEAANGRYSLDYADVHSAIDVLAAYGSAGDSVLTEYTFVKSGGYC